MAELTDPENLKLTDAMATSQTERLVTLSARSLLGMLGEERELR
jgi:hypothetical protein